MGIVYLPSIYDYWKKDAIFHYSPVASQIPRDRFFELHRYLHFAENSTLSLPGEPGYDKLGKIKLVHLRVRKVFRSVYCPPQNVSIEEAMIRLKERSTLNEQPAQKRGVTRRIPDVIYSNHAGSDPCVRWLERQGLVFILYIHIIHLYKHFTYVTKR